MLLACAERAGVVDQNWDRDAEGAGEKRLPQFQGPLDAVAANVRQKGQGSVIQFPGLSSFFVGLEHQHLLPENRVVIEGKIFLRGLKEALLSEACLLIGLTEGNEGCVILDELTGEAALGGDGGDGLVCAGGAGGGQLVELREDKDTVVRTRLPLFAALLLRWRGRRLLQRRRRVCGRICALKIPDESSRSCFKRARLGAFHVSGSVRSWSGKKLRCASAES